MPTSDLFPLQNPARIAIRQPDGSFKDLGEVSAIKSVDALPLTKPAEPWFTNPKRDLSFSVEIPATPENRKSFQKLREQGEKAEINAVVNMIRRVGRRSHFECKKEHYKHLSGLVHKHYGMNFTRYCRSVGVRYFTGFRVWLGDNGKDHLR